MNNRSFNSCVIIIIMAKVLLLPLHTSGKQGSIGKAGAKNKSSMISYKNYIWIEGENAVATNFSKEKTYNFFCSDRHALQLSKDADPTSDKGYYATYIFYVPGTKSYDFWMGCSPPGSVNSEKPGYASPFDWKIDNGIFRKASSENSYVKEYYAPGSYYWTKISSGTLSQGKHTLTVRVNQKRSSGWDYYFYIDAIIFLPTYSGYLTPLMQFPEKAPSDFNDKAKGIVFSKEEYYKKRLKENRNDRESLFTLLQIYNWLYEYEKSIDLCKDYLKRNPGDTQIRLLLASNLAWSDRLDEAIKEYKNIISIDKKNITSRKLLAVLAGWNNRYNEAIKNYKEIITVDKFNVDAYISLATQYSWKGEADKALDVFKRAESIAPDNIDVLYALGDNYSWTGKTYEAIRQFKRIISIDERQIEAYKKLGKIYLGSGQNHSALEIMDEAIRVAQIYPELSGFSLDIKGEMDSDRMATIEEYKKALKRNPDNLETRKNLIDSYIWNKMDDDAIEEYNNLLNLKVVNEMDITDAKITNIAIESIKFRISSIVVDSIKEKIERIKEQYNEAISLINDGDSLPEELNSNKIKSDLVLIKSLIDKIDIFELNLSRFNDVIRYYDKDIQSYTAQKNALKWGLDKDRVLKQAILSEEVAPDDYRPKKVIGVIEYLYGDLEDAYNKLNFVYQKAEHKAFPVYYLNLSDLSQYKKVEQLIIGLLKNKKTRVRHKKSLKELLEFTKALRELPASDSILKGDNKTFVKEINKLSVSAFKRLSELIQEQKGKQIIAKTTIRQIYEKTFLDLENGNVAIYNEIANYHLNRGNQHYVLDFYNRILSVQPLNIEINYKLGNQNEALGYWMSAMENYEICINNQPDHQLARKGHYDLQEVYSPSVNNTSTFYEDEYDNKKLTTRVNNQLEGIYPITDWLSFTAGHEYLKIDDQFSINALTIGGQSYYPAEGSVTRNSGVGGLILNVVPLGMKMFLTGVLHNYKGKVDFKVEEAGEIGGVISEEKNNELDSDIAYSSINYSAGIDFISILKGLQLKFVYAFKDEADQTQPLKMNFRKAVTYQLFQGILDFNFTELHFPLSDRIFLYDSFNYRIMSDDNIRKSSFNQLTFRALRIPTHDMNLDIYAIGGYEWSMFTHYDDEKEIRNLPYWAPRNIRSVGGGISWKHGIDNIFKGKLSYELSLQYGRNSIKYSDIIYTQTNYTSGIKFSHDWDKVNYYISGSYGQSTAEKTKYNSDPKPYISRNIEFGVQGKFFSVYIPEGLGGANIVMITASPNMITADGDGKDDFTTFTLTSFDEKGIIGWELEIFDKKGNKVKSFGRKGTPPATIKWDGTDKAHNILPREVYNCQLAIVNTADERSVSKKKTVFLSRKKRAITPQVSYLVFSPNSDRVKDTLSIELKATDKSSVKSWSLFVMDKKTKIKKAKQRKRKIFRIINGFEFLPYDVEWDGKDNKGNILPDGDYYLSVEVDYRDGKRIISPEIQTRISTKASVTIKANTKKFIPGAGMLRVTVVVSDKDTAQWKLSVYSIDEKLIKMIHGSGKVPDKIVWKGVDEADNIVGYNMPITAVMDIMDKAGNKGVSNRETIWLDFLKEKKKDMTLITLYDQGIMHKRKDAKLSNIGEEISKRLVNVLKKNRNISKIRVVSHTSSEGSEEINLELSRKRAKAFGLLIKEGLKLKTGIVNIRGMGESTQDAKFEDRKWDARYEVEIY